MSDWLKKGILVVCIGSMHFGATFASYFGALWANAKPAPLLESTLSRMFEILSFPGSLSFGKLYSADQSFGAYLFVTAMSSLLWGVVLMPALVHLRRLWCQRRIARQPSH